MLSWLKIISSPVILFVQEWPDDFRHADICGEAEVGSVVACESGGELTLAVAEFPVVIKELALVRPRPFAETGVDGDDFILKAEAVPIIRVSEGEDAGDEHLDSPVEHDSGEVLYAFFDESLFVIDAVDADEHEDVFRLIGEDIVIDPVEQAVDVVPSQPAVEYAVSWKKFVQWPDLGDRVAEENIVHLSDSALQLAVIEQVPPALPGGVKFQCPAAAGVVKKLFNSHADILP